VPEGGAQSEANPLTLAPEESRRTVGTALPPALIAPPAAAKQPPLVQYGRQYLIERLTADVVSRAVAVAAPHIAQPRRSAS
jgi:hypothetical protein